jgi:hypothetical protein
VDVLVVGADVTGVGELGFVVVGFGVLQLSDRLYSRRVRAAVTAMTTAREVRISFSFFMK